jgi:membrane associated rhomboid family serine protease
MFGMQTERFYGAVGEGNGALLFIALYIGGVIFSSLPSYRKHLDNPSYNAIGASGATSAVLFAYVLMSPFQKLSLLFLPGIDFYAWIFGLLYLAYEYYMDKRSTDNVAHDAHFYGALYGILFTAALDPQLVLNFGYLNS